ncbi:MAG: DUF192 domain-containing protein [Pseudomonadota bacterium]
MKLLRFSAFALSSVGLVALASADPMQVTPLTIVSGDTTHTFSVEVADDREEISFGLMERESMDTDKGMLFDFNPPYEPSMYMKNTLIPLDMLFIANDGSIEMIARNTVPGSLRTVSPGVAVRGVLEINGGQAAELGIEPGDTVQHPIFGNAEAETDTEAE